MALQPAPQQPPSGDLVASPLPGEQPQGWLQRASSSIGTVIIVPYLTLVALIAILGLYIITRLIAESFEERFTNQLLDAGRVASDGLVRHERQHLEALRLMAQTVGVADALAANDPARLRELLEVLAQNAEVDSVMVLDATGELVLRLDAVHNTSVDFIDDYQFSAGGNYAGLPVVAPILAGFSDELGDKFAGLVESPMGTMLYSSAPVHLTEDDGTSRMVGAILVGTTLDRILRHLETEALADIVVYTRPGTPVGSTLPDWQAPEQFSALAIDENLYQQAIVTPGNTPLANEQGLTLFQRGYRIAYTSMVIRGRSVGVMGVLLPGQFVFSAVSTSREIFIVIFTVGVILAVILGWAISRQITNPVMKLVDLSRAVASGDLTRRANVRDRNELGILGNTFNDMTDKLQRYTGALEAEIARTQSILDSIADGVIVRDLEGNVIMANPAARAMLSDERGFEPDRLRLFSIPKDMAEITRRMEFGDRTISISMATVKLDEGERIGDVLVLRDVTHETIAERTKDNFLNQIGHELRTPLTSIKGYSDLLRMGIDQIPAVKRDMALNSIYQSSLTLTSMIDQIIDLTAMQGGSLQLSTEPVSLQEIIQRTLADWEQHLLASNLKVNFKPGKTILRISGDARRIRRALDALLHNACDFSPDGGPLGITLTRSDNLACVSVADPGVGIRLEDLPHIFERFFRGSPRDAKGNPIDIRGMGQGLYIVKSIMEAHNGTVQVESAIGKGSTFRLYFPLLSDS